MPNSEYVTLEIELREHLITEDTDAGDRIYPDILPQKPTYPAITYQQILSSSFHDIDVDFPRYQITAWHPRRIDAMNLADQIDRALTRYKGALGTIPVKQIVKEPSPGVLFDRDAGADGAYYVPQDFKIIYVRQKG